MTTTEQWPLGRRIQSARVRAGLSKRAAARAAGISDARWRQLETGEEIIRGRRFPTRTTPETIMRVAQALKIPPSELLAEAGFDPDVVAHAPVGVPVESVDVTGLNQADVDQVRNFIAFLRQQRAQDEPQDH